MIIESFRYNTITDEKHRQLKSLMQTAWSNHGETSIHPKEMDAMCFCGIIDGVIIGYVGIVSWTIFIEKESYRMCGLSCVCTHPAYQRCGIGQRLVVEATQWIATAGIFDIGLFTCSATLSRFYEQGGDWQHDSCLVLKESARDGAYASDQLKLQVLKFLISDKAKQNPSYFTEREIVLNFPHGQFI